MKKLPAHCPSCEGRLVVKRLRCERCETEVDGLYPLPPLSSFSSGDQTFIQQFVKSSGSLKEMAKLTKVSYPTVRNKLNDIIDQLKKAESEIGDPL